MFKSAAFLITINIVSLFSAVVSVGDSDSNGLCSPVGLWKTFDADGKVESLVKINEHNGALYATVVEVLASEAQKGNHVRCTWCKGKRKDQPLVGMTIMGGMKKDGDEWSGGWIFDPKRDLTAKCRLMLLNGGKKLKVRGYLTFFLGETRYWKRIH
jgi:uncharacterized protein (DUF2147 family)